MRSHTSLAVTLFAAVTALVLLAGPVSAQQSRRGGLSGDWNVKIEFNGRTDGLHSVVLPRPGRERDGPMDQLHGRQRDERRQV